MMIIKNIDMRLIKTEKREGISRTEKKPYLFYTSKFLDNEGDMILLKWSNEMLKNEKVMAQILAAPVNTEATITLGLYPAGFQFKGIVLSIDI